MSSAMRSPDVLVSAGWRAVGTAVAVVHRVPARPGSSELSAAFSPQEKDILSSTENLLEIVS